MSLEDHMRNVEQQVKVRDAVRSGEARARLRVGFPLGVLAFLAWLSIPWIAIQWHYFSLSPLQRAAYDGNELECERLVKAGAPIDATDDAGQTALYYAAWHGHLEATRTLISLGAEVNKLDLSGHTLLQQYESATGRGRPRGTSEQQQEIAKLLRAHGAR